MAEQDPTPSTPEVTQMQVTDTPERLPLVLLRIAQAFSTITTTTPVPAGEGLVVVHVTAVL